MFSGIIADIGNIKQATDRDGGLRLVISTGVLDLGDVQIGDSIAVNGVCLTVIAHTNGYPDTEGGTQHEQEGQPGDCSRNRLASPGTRRRRPLTLQVSRE